MARPIKDGVDYFPLDTNIFSSSADDGFRMLKASQGAKGVVVYLYLLCQIYGKNGYFLPWDDDAGVLASDGVGCSCTPQYIIDVVNCCVKRGLFDKHVFTEYGVLTSRGIQRRYVRMFNSRDEIRMKREYFLLDVNSKKDITESILRKLVLFSDKSTGNPDKSTGNPDKSTGNPQKEKEIEIEKEIEKEKGNGGSFAVFDDLPEWKEFLNMRRRKGSLSYKVIEMIRDDLKKYSGGDMDKAVKILRYSIKGGYPLLYPLTESKDRNVKSKKDTSFDLDEYEQITDVNPEYKETI